MVSSSRAFIWGRSANSVRMAPGSSVENFLLAVIVRAAGLARIVDLEHAQHELADLARGLGFEPGDSLGPDGADHPAGDAGKPHENRTPGSPTAVATASLCLPHELSRAVARRSAGPRRPARFEDGA